MWIYVCMMMKSSWRGTFSGCVVEQQSTPVVSSLIETVDRVMEHMVTNMEPTSNSLFSLGGTSSVAGQKWVSSMLQLSRWDFSTLTLMCFWLIFPQYLLNVFLQQITLWWNSHRTTTYNITASPHKGGATYLCLGMPLPSTVSICMS